MTVNQALETEDVETIINRMERYATGRLATAGVKDFNGRQACDFVGDVILKAVEGTRKWDSAKISFTEFLFGCLRSEISNFFTYQRSSHLSDPPESLPELKSARDIEEDRSEISEMLEKTGASGDELIVFECWADGLTKPKRVAEYLGVSVESVYKISESLKNRLAKIKHKIAV